MKRLVVLAAVAGLGYLAYRAWAQSQEENDVWAEATDPVAPADLR